MTAILWLCSCLGAAAATPWFARVWQADDGLPGDNVSGVAQTRDGYLWIGTQSGLARFDGVRIVPVDVPQGRPRPIIRALFLDVNQQLWLAEERGVVVRLASGESRLFTSTNGLPAAQPLRIVQTADGAIWIAYVDGSVSRIQRDKVTRFSGRAAPPGRGTGNLAVDAQGQLWFARGGQVGRFRDGAFVSELTLRERFVEVQGGSGNRVWICAGDRLLTYEPGTTPVEKTRLPVPSVLVTPTALLEDRAGNVWIGTRTEGLFQFDGTNVFHVATSHPRIRSITEDREGNIWVGTDGGGLNRLRPQVLELQGREAGLPFDTVRSVCEDLGGKLWVVTQNGAVATSTGEGWNEISAMASWPGGQATCVTCDTNGVVWIGTYSRGLYRWGAEGGSFDVIRPTNGLASASIRCLLADRAGGVWIAFSASNILQHLRQAQFQNLHLPKGSGAVRAMAEDARGDLWLANLDACLLRVRGEAVIDETPRVRGQLRPIRCLTATADGSLWIGYSAAGIGRLKDGQQELIDSARGLQDDSICSLVLDRFGWFWVGSDHGIFSVNARELAQAMTNTTAVRCISYGRDQGVPSLQGAYGYCPGAARTRDGRILIPTHAGLAIVHPGRVETNHVRPPVIIESVLVDNRVVRTGPSYLSLTLPPTHRKLEVAFTAPSFIEADKVRFRYRLQGLDDNWVEAGYARSAVYPRLPFGKYRFQVAAGNNAGVWNDTGAFLALDVKPFLWQTWWFRLVVILVFAALVFAVARYVSFRRLRSKLRQLERATVLQDERARIAKDIHDDLGARMTQMSLLTELTQKALAEPQKASPLVAQIATMSRQGIKSVDEIVWAVNPRNDNLPDLLDYVGQYAVDFLQAAGVACRVDFPTPAPPWTVPAPTRHGLFLATKEALNNIVKHAQATEVWVRASLNDSALRWVIEDNGRGFDQRPPDSLADGLRNMQQRMKELGGDCTTHSRVGTGTTIVFTVPLPPG